MLTLVLTIIIFLLYLIYERILINRWINSIPLRISVTGTRGKSSVVRMLSSVLREDGKRVLAKTTGSEAKFILPNGEEREVSRQGVPSIIEQKKLLKKAAAMNVDCIVAEIMSIHAENHYIESCQLLKPHIVIITNVRLDHTDAIGKTKDEISSVISLDIPEKSKVFIPKNEIRSIFLTTIKNKGRELIEISEEISSAILEIAPELKTKHFLGNLDIVYALGQHFSIREKTILNGIRKAKYDIGQFKILKYRLEKGEKTCYFVNGFSSNDPESTFEVILKIREIIPSASTELIGLLSLRSDRGDRTMQWIAALKNGGSEYFNRIYVLGVHAKIVKRKLKWVDVLKDKSVEKITEAIFSNIRDQSVIFGFGNIGGTGRLLVDYWDKLGEEYGI